MIKLETYKTLNLLTEEQVFNYFLETLKESIFTWDYFVDFNKCEYNVNKIKDELTSLDHLINKKGDQFNTSFIHLLYRNPRIRSVLPILIAIRNKKICNTQIISNIDTMTSGKKNYLFDANETLTTELVSELISFMYKSNLYNLFQSGISSLYDYCLGVEVGMDTNARKNRTGSQMENIVEVFLRDLSNVNGYQYMNQATYYKIKSEWGIEIAIDKINRRFDFAINANSRLYLIEVNYYSGGGSKLKSTAGEYKEVQKLLKPQRIDFIWITDGIGWKAAKTALNEAFKNNDYIFNLEMLKNGVLEDVIK